MTTFAKVRNGIVQRVIVADPSFFDTFVDDTSGPWIETSKDIRKIMPELDILMIRVEMRLYPQSPFLVGY